MRPEDEAITLWQEAGGFMIDGLPAYVNEDTVLKLIALSRRGYAKIMPPVPRPPLQIEERT
jgi:hypothetical protein